jgi:hypothetical protein
LLPWTDVPWCEGDLYFIEKCAIALGVKRIPWATRAVDSAVE